MTMTRFLSTSLLLVPLLVVAGAQPTLAPSVSITLSAPQTSIKIGSEIWIDAVTTNISDHAVNIGFFPGPYESEDIALVVQVRDSQDHAVGPEKLDQRACEGVPNCKVLQHEMRKLGPGESAKDHFLIDNKKYDLRHAGTYTIQIMRRDIVTLETVKSNLLTITVTQ